MYMPIALDEKHSKTIPYIHQTGLLLLNMLMCSDLTVTMIIEKKWVNILKCHVQYHTVVLKFKHYLTLKNDWIRSHAVHSYEEFMITSGLWTYGLLTPHEQNPPVNST